MPGSGSSSRRPSSKWIGLTCCEGLFEGAVSTGAWTVILGLSFVGIAAAILDRIEKLRRERRG